jgi:hypothetical protein
VKQMICCCNKVYLAQAIYVSSVSARIALFLLIVYSNYTRFFA